MSWQKISIIIGVIVVGGGLVLWGVPYFLKSEVHDLYAAEAKAAPAPSVPQAVIENTAAVKALGTQLAGMENRLIARDKIQAERDAVIMQYFADKAK